MFDLSFEPNWVCVVQTWNGSRVRVLCLLITLFSFDIHVGSPGMHSHSNSSHCCVCPDDCQTGSCDWGWHERCFVMLVFKWVKQGSCFCTFRGLASYAENYSCQKEGRKAHNLIAALVHLLHGVMECKQHQGKGCVGLVAPCGLNGGSR